MLGDGQNLQALEVKSGHNVGNVSGLAAFMRQFGEAKPLVIGTGGMPLDVWLQSGLGKDLLNDQNIQYYYLVATF